MEAADVDEAAAVAPVARIASEEIDAAAAVGPAVVASAEKDAPAMRIEIEDQHEQPEEQPTTPVAVAPDERADDPYLRILAAGQASD